MFKTEKEHFSSTKLKMLNPTGVDGVATTEQYELPFGSDQAAIMQFGIAESFRNRYVQTAPSCCEPCKTIWVENFSMFGGLLRFFGQVLQCRYNEEDLPTYDKAGSNKLASAIYNITNIVDLNVLFDQVYTIPRHGSSKPCFLNNLFDWQKANVAWRPTQHHLAYPLVFIWRRMFTIDKITAHPDIQLALRILLSAEMQYKKEPINHPTPQRLAIVDPVLSDNLIKFKLYVTLGNYLRGRSNVIKCMLVDAVVVLHRRTDFLCDRNGTMDIDLPILLTMNISDLKELVAMIAIEMPDYKAF